VHLIKNKRIVILSKAKDLLFGFTLTVKIFFGTNLIFSAHNAFSTQFNCRF